MSDFAGLWRLDGAPIWPADLDALALALEGRGIGAPRVWCGGAIAIVHRQHCFTAEDADEVMPCVGSSGAVLSADVRLGARAELAEALGERNHALTDGALLLAALQRWHVAALPRIQGPYALALYRPALRQLMLARDPVGTRSLFVHRGPGLVAFATRLRALLVLPDIPTDLDEQALASHLIMDRSHPARTVYRAIERVPMGQALILTADDTKVESWWSPPEAGSLRLGSDADVEAAAADVLDRVVADALRTAGPAAVCLTGGLDSGSVALSAARQSAPASVLTLTRIPQHATATATTNHYYDESRRARLLAAVHPGLDWHALGDDTDDWGEHDRLRWLRESGQPMRSPLNLAWFFPFYRFLEARGGRVLLGGEFGNAFFSYDGMARLPQLLWKRKWGDLMTQTGAVASAQGLSLRKALQRHVLRPFAPMALLRRWHRLPADLWALEAALQPAWGRELQLRQTLDTARYRMRLGGRHHSVAAIREWLLGNATAMDCWGVLRGMSGVDVRLPLADRRVIEFFGALPLDQFLRDGVSRSLPRRLLAARGAPADIVENHAVGVQNGDWFTHLSLQRSAMQEELKGLRESPLASRIIDLERLQHLLDRWPRDAAAAERKRGDYLQVLVNALQMGGFLAWRERGGY